MKPAKLSTPDRDAGRPSIQPLVKRLIDRLESIERRLAKKDGGPVVALTAEREMLAKLDAHAGDVISLERRRVLQRAADEVYFRVPLAAGYVTYENGAVTNPKNGDEIVSRFAVAAAGVNIHMQRTVDTRQLWVRTRPRIHVWYTSPVGSVNTFSLRFVLRVFGAGNGTTSTVSALDWTPAGPAVANTVLYTSAVVTSAVFPSSPFGVTQLRLGRLGGDANANDLDILLAVVEFQEAA